MLTATVIQNVTVKMLAMYWNTYIYAKPVATSGIPIWFSEMIMTCAEDEQLSTDIINLINLSLPAIKLQRSAIGITMYITVIGANISLRSDF